MKRIATPIAFAVMLTFGLLTGHVHANEAAKITVTDAWARAAAIVGGNGAGFFVLENHATEDDELLRVEAGISKAAELHTMTMDGNIMRMRKLDSLPLPANGKSVFAPGGNHVMFIGLKAPLKEGESFPLTLVFKKAGAVAVDVAILKTAPNTNGAAHSHAH